MEDAHMRKLLDRYLEGKCTEEEQMKIEAWYQSLGKQPAEQVPHGEIEEDARLVFQRIQTAERRSKLHRLRRLVAVAAVLLAVAFSVVLMRQPGVSEAEPVAALDTFDVHAVMPGSDKAILELADGRSISISLAEMGTLAADEFGSIIKDGESSLSYLGFGDDAGEPVYNTFRTPRGGQFQVTLPDGSRVWLNAASSIRYAPNRFRSERKLVLEGEAFFDVVTDADKPFVVATASETVTVLGTQFNVNSYAEEPVTKTTLVSGVVTVSTGNGEAKRLAPGEQALVGTDGQVAVSKGNVEQATAWRAGVFSFDGADVGEVMRQLSRWYDVEVVFEGKVPDTKLYGKVNRNAAVATPLELLEFFELRHKANIINGKRQITIFAH